MKASKARLRHRLNSRGDRQLHFAIHVAAVTQLRYPDQGRGYYNRERAEGKSTKKPSGR
jgi:transposase